MRLEINLLVVKDKQTIDIINRIMTMRENSLAIMKIKRDNLGVFVKDDKEYLFYSRGFETLDIIVDYFLDNKLLKMVQDDKH